MWTSERDKHNQEEKSEDEEPDAELSRTRKQMIKQGIMDIYEDVLLFEEEIKMVKEQMRRRKLMKRLQQKKYVKLLSVPTNTQSMVHSMNSKTCFCS